MGQKKGFQTAGVSHCLHGKQCSCYRAVQEISWVLRGFPKYLFVFVSTIHNLVVFNYNKQFQIHPAGGPVGVVPATCVKHSVRHFVFCFEHLLCRVLTVQIVLNKYRSMSRKVTIWSQARYFCVCVYVSRLTGEILFVDNQSPVAWPGAGLDCGVYIYWSYRGPAAAGLQCMRYERRRAEQTARLDRLHLKNNRNFYTAHKNTLLIYIFTYKIFLIYSKT